MTFVSEGLVNLMKNDAGLSAVISGRVYPLALPDNCVFPAITFSLVDSPKTRSHSSKVNLSRPRYQFDCWAKSYGEIEQMNLALNNLFEGFTGMVGQSHKSGGSFNVLEADAYEADTGLFHRIVDFQVWIKEQ